MDADKLIQQAKNEVAMDSAKQITENLKLSSINIEADREIIALIAYLHRLGVDIHKTK